MTDHGHAMSSDNTKSGMTEKLPHMLPCLADVLALGVPIKTNKSGVNIPDRLSPMGLENLDCTADCPPHLPTISSPAASMGKSTTAAVSIREITRSVATRIHAPQ